MTRAYFCLTHDRGETIPTIHVNGHELRLSREEFFRLMGEAVWVAKSLTPHTAMHDTVEKFYRSTDPTL